MSSDPLAKRTAKPLEGAQLVWQRAREFVDPTARHDRSALALELLRTAGRDPTGMAHALTLGRTHVDAHADDVQARGAVDILERAISFLGVKPAKDDAAAGPRVE